MEEGRVGFFFPTPKASHGATSVKVAWLDLQPGQWASSMATGRGRRYIDTADKVSPAICTKILKHRIPV